MIDTIDFVVWFRYRTLIFSDIARPAH